MPRKTCYRVQAHSACCRAGQGIQEMRCWGKAETLVREPANWEDGRLVPQNNHLVGVWMPGFFYRSERKKQWGTKVKGRIERERQGAGERVFSLVKHPQGMARLQKGGGVLISSIHRWAEKRHFSLQSRRRAGSFGQAIEYDYSNKSNKKASQWNSFQHGVRIGFLPATRSF